MNYPDIQQHDTFLLQSHLNSLTEQGRQLACTAKTPEEFTAWQSKARSELYQILRLHKHTHQLGEATLLREVRHEDYTEQQWQLAIDEGVHVNAYILKPHGEGPFIPVLCLHGHNPSVQTIIGYSPDEEHRERQLAKDGYYAQSLCKAGYLVCAVEQRGFGERQSGGQGTDGKEWSCRHLFLHYLMHDRVLQGEKVWDAMRALDWFLQRDDILPEYLTSTGNSGGGTTTIYLAALDERVKIAIPGCAFSSYRESIQSEHFTHCHCNYIPGLSEQMESGDVVAMIAPRPLCIINGEHDMIFPIKEAREQYKIVENAYQAMGHPERCQHAVHPEGHRYHLGFATAWLERWSDL